MAVNYVKFIRGTPTAFAKLSQKDNDTLYFISEVNSKKGSLYLGEKLISESIANLEDLSNIWRYTAKKWSIKQADKYYNILISFFKNIATNPFLYGMKYAEIIDELFGTIIKEHIVFYKINNNEIIIIRILHKRMDFKNKFK